MNAPPPAVPPATPTTPATPPADPARPRPAPGHGSHGGGTGDGPRDREGDRQRFRDLGRTRGLAAGLAAVLEGLDLPSAAPQGVAAVPAGMLPDGVPAVPSALAASEGVALVRFPPGPGARAGRGLTGARCAALAAVRLGLLERMLDLAVERLARRHFGGVRLIDQQLVAGAVADVATAIEAAAAAPHVDGTPARVLAARHEDLTGAGWTTTRFFGAEGYLTDHPVRCLYVSGLVADIWVPSAAPAAEEE